MTSSIACAPLRGLDEDALGAGRRQPRLGGDQETFLMPALPPSINWWLRSSSESCRRERRQIAHGGLVALLDLARLEHDVIDGKDFLHVIERELAALGDDLDHHLPWLVGREQVQHREHRAEEQRAEAGDRKSAQAGGHAQAHQDEQHRDVARILDRRAEPDDAGGAGDAERPRQRAADDDHHQRAGHAQQHLRLLQRRIGRAIGAVVALHDRHEHADDGRDDRACASSNSGDSHDGRRRRSASGVMGIDARAGTRAASGSR